MSCARANNRRSWMPRTKAWPATTPPWSSCRCAACLPGLLLCSTAGLACSLLLVQLQVPRLPPWPPCCAARQNVLALFSFRGVLPELPWFSCRCLGCLPPWPPCCASLRSSVPLFS